MDFSEISLFNGEVLEIYQPTFLMIIVTNIPITKIEKKVGFHLSYEYITTKIASINQNIYLEKYISFIR